MFGDVKNREVKNRNVVRVLSIVIFFLVWQCFSMLEFLPLAVPSPYEIILFYSSRHFVQNIFPSLVHSLTHILVGFGAALIVALPLGLLMGWFNVVRSIVDPIVELFRPIPPIAWVAISLIMFTGYLEVSAFVIFVGSFFPILTNTFYGFKSVPVEYLEVAKSLGAEERDLILKVAIPWALPAVLTGFRVGLGVGWMCVIAAEMFGVPGLGWMIMQMEYLHNLPGVMAYMFLIGFLGFLMEKLVRLMEGWMLKWQRGLIRG